MVGVDFSPRPLLEDACLLTVPFQQHRQGRLMDLNQPGFTSALDLAAAIRAKQLSPVEVVEGALSRIEQLNPALNAFSEVLADDARAAARAAESAVQHGDDLGPLHGVPV